MTASPQNPAASTRAPVASRRAALRGGPAAPGSPPLAAGGKTSRPAGSPSHLPGGTSTSPLDRGRAVAGTVAGSGGVDGTRDAAENPLPAGTTGRTYMVILPAGLKMLNLNDRLHWAEERRRARDIKKAAWAVALCDKLPRLGRVSVTAEYQPPDRRHRDGDNIAISAKHALDGIVAAGCLPGDDRRYVTGTFCTIGEPYPKGRLILHLTEVAAAAESDGAA